MTQSHLVSDTLTRIRNSQLVGKKSTIVMYSRIVDNLLEILIREVYILSKEKFLEKKGIDKIRVFLKYNNSHVPAISEISTVSKPGRRVYKSYKNVGNMSGGLGILILSTSRGVITDHTTRTLKTGGEVLCKVF